jgi:hypothetical protein
MLHDGRLPDRRPGGAGMMIGPGVRLICEIDPGVLLVSTFLGRRECFLCPLPPPFQVAFQRLPDWPLWGETRRFQDLADILRRVVNPEFAPDQGTHYLPGPQAEVELHLPRVPRSHLRSCRSCLSASRLFLSDAILVDSAARPPSRNLCCQS